MDGTNLGNNSSCAKNPEPSELVLPEDVEISLTESKHGYPKSKFPQYPCETGSKLGKTDTRKEKAKAPKRLSRNGKKPATRSRSKKYLLRSSFNSSRVLRSMSKGATVTPPPVNDNPINHIKGKRKIRKKKLQRSVDDQYSKIRKTVRYLLHRMSYERSLIDAYAGEGWKGQSSEKIKPEMELQRAKSEILRCKLKIRNLFQQLDSLMSEGKLNDSFFDSEGEICSEDIFCAKCRSKDVSLENDIVLCDGICDRGFHQMCLDPPLLKDDIPPGDEGWLCPGCDCKVDCLDLINETQGTYLSFEDEWEKVFPEAAAFASSGLSGDLELPSDDSEDDNYDPDNLEADKELEEGSSSDDSDFTSTSDDSKSSDRNMHNENFGFPSDDSEDFDYDPDKPNLEQKAAEYFSSSDSSDFTSDTDDLNIPDTDALDVNEVSSYRASKFPVSVIHSHKENAAQDTNKSAAKSLLPPLESGKEQEIVVPLSGKRHRERLDYKKLYDDAYGNILSGSSDDDEWTDVTTNMLDCDATREDAEGLMEVYVETVQNRRSKRIKGKQKADDKDGVCAEMTENSRKVETSRELQTALPNHSIDKESLFGEQPDSSDQKTPRSSTRYSAASFQKLQKPFIENRYHSCKNKEHLARELGMDMKQVNEWFDKAHHSFGVSAKATSPKGIEFDGSISQNETSNSCIKHQRLQESFGEGKYPTREVKDRLAGELNMTVQQVNKWFENARRRHRSSPSKMSPAGPSSVRATSKGETPNTTSTQEAVGSNGPCEGHPPEILGKSPRHVSTSKSRDSKKGRANTKEVDGGSISREQLVMRELRKRRLSK